MMGAGPVHRAWLVGLIGLVLGLTALPARAGVELAQEPVLLVAHPRMEDPGFSQTVVVVTFPQDAGPMGVILNRPYGVTLEEVLTDRPDVAGRTDMVYFGGPVRPDGILFLFRATEHPVKALPVAEDVYLSGDGELFERLVSRPGEAAGQRFFAGYAGWAEGQLDAEVRRGDWYVLPVDPEVLFAPPAADLWERLLQRARSLTARAE
jgi:putative transcriptional regulator